MNTNLYQLELEQAAKRLAEKLDRIKADPAEKRWNVEPKGSTLYIVNRQAMPRRVKS